MLVIQIVRGPNSKACFIRSAKVIKSNSFAYFVIAYEILKTKVSLNNFIAPNKLSHTLKVCIMFKEISDVMGFKKSGSGPVQV